MSVKQIYHSLINNNYIPPVAENSWETLLCLNSKHSWSDVWKNCWCNLLGNDDKDVWFKLKHKILPTKDKLYKMGIAADETCFILSVGKGIYPTPFSIM